MANNFGEPALINVGGQVSNLFSLPVQGQAGAGMPPELVKNGGFESPVFGTWIEYVAPNSVAQATFERTTSTAREGLYFEHISITRAGFIALLQLGIPVVQGTAYALQFWAKSSTPRGLAVGVLSDADFHSFGLSTSITLGNTDWQLYRATFQATETNTGRLLSILAIKPARYGLTA